MRINRSYAMAAAAWLVLVVVGAVLVWAVISRAGQGVVSSAPGSSVGQAAPITAAPQSKHTKKPKSGKPKPHRPSGSASASPRGGSPDSGPSQPGSSSSAPNSGPQSPAPPPASSSAPDPGPAPAPGPAPGPNPSSPHNPPPSSSPPPPKSTQDSGVTRSWQGSAGVVTVECRGPNISLKGAQPNSGWSIDVDSRGPEEVRVDFESGERRTRVQAECVGGTPRFQIDQGDD
jgi:hypothetical protein